MLLSYIRMTPGQRRASPSSRAAARDRLLAATTELIAAGGPSAATSRAISAAAGANLGSITYYFGSKEHLIAESLIAAARQLIEPVVNELTDQSAEPVSKMLSAVQLLQQILTHNREWLPGYLQSLAAATRDETVNDEVRRLHRALAAALADEIRTQQEAGSLPQWVTPDPMAKLIVGLANGVAVASAIDPEETDTAAIGGQFAQLLLSARTTPTQANAPH